MWIEAVVGLGIFVLGFFLGWLWNRSDSDKQIGTLSIVEWADGTNDLLMETKVAPIDLKNGQTVSLYVHKTRR